MSKATGTESGAEKASRGGSAESAGKGESASKAESAGKAESANKGESAGKKGLPEKAAASYPVEDHDPRHSGSTLYEPGYNKNRSQERVMSATRFLAFVPVVGLLLASVIMMVIALIHTVVVSLEAVEGELDVMHLVVEYIDMADIFLLAIVLYIMALGIFSLFIDDRVPLPKWLEIDDLDDLKEKLISVICVVLVVYFLGKVINGLEPVDALFLGGGIGVVVAACALFVKSVMKGH